ncbi:DUF4011 domain-containing protein [Candidatus Bathyarchaeota archaeon]|nr:MAG: DUF4011 domain-containing protein [Candidatus Bathyarchaeota archaeon]
MPIKREGLDDKDEARVRRRIRDWKRRLIDLSRRNRLIYFRPTKRGNLSISHPDIYSIFNRLVLRRGTLGILASFRGA